MWTLFLTVAVLAGEARLENRFEELATGLGQRRENARCVGKHGAAFGVMPRALEPSGGWREIAQKSV